MRFAHKRARANARGQVLVMFVGGFLALIGATAVVVDGGNAMAQQRSAQNGADAAAEAGTVVIAQYLMGGSSATGAVGTCPTGTADPWDVEVCKAVYGSAANNAVDISQAQYADFKGDLLGNVGGGAMPAGAQGVRAYASRDFGTYFARALGFTTIKTTTQATAATGKITTLCAPGSTCGLFPITVPYVTSTCDGSGTLVPGVGDWPFLGDTDTTPANEAIVPLCKDKNDDIGGGSAGSVGWLDYSTALGAVTDGTCAGQFKDAILDPCIVSLKFPTWIQTFTGGVGKGGPAIQDAINTYHDNVVQIPLFDGTCKQKPAGPDLLDCATGDIGTGVNTWYHIPSFASFKIDLIYINGADRKECDNLPGSPFVSGNGANGCLKGWWVVALPGPGAIDLGPVTRSTSNKLGVLLIK
jgi:Flp pilus assembly protein TadG